MAAGGDFCKTQLYRRNAKYHKACFKCLKNVPIVFSPRVLPPYRTLCLQKMAARRDFVKRNFTDGMLSNRRLASNVSYVPIKSFS